MSRRQVYLDYNASAPLLAEARKAIVDALDIAGNPASVHKQGRALKAIVQKARRQVAELVGAKPDHVVFTSGATEAAAMVLTPSYTMGRSPVAMSHLYVTASDHPCVLAGGRFAPEQVTQLPVDDDGLLKLDALEAALAGHDRQAGTALVATHWANNETGVIQPIEEISAVVKRHGGVFVVDAVQAAGRLPVDISQGHADYLILSAHKIGGPKGAGALIAFSDLMMPLPLISGGGQERGHRGGTEAVSMIAGFGAAADVAKRELDAFAALDTKRDKLIADLRQVSNRVIIHGEATPRVANTVLFSLEGKKAETMQIAFDLAGYAVSSGSACSSGKVGQSHVLQAMGVKGDEGAVRVSFGRDVVTSELEGFVSEFQRIAAR